MSPVQLSALTVTQYASRIGRAVRAAGGAIVEGEVQKPRFTGGGMLFFDLTDGDSTLSCKVFRNEVARLAHRPQEGDLVQVAVERPDFYAAQGRLSLVVAEVRLAGVGELLRRREELRRRLAHEGLTDPARRKPRPRFPRAVGVIAGRDSDAMTDVVRALRDRFAPVHIVACAALVQGKAAPRDVIDAIACMEVHPLVDVIVIARGGGSVQDLVAFDDEQLCRAIFGCSKPVVTAIGHTENTPVCNDVAHAAFTPSRSAELAVPSAVELGQELLLARQTLDCVPARLERRIDRVDALCDRLDLAVLLDGRASRVRACAHDMTLAEQAFFASHERGLAAARAALDFLQRALPAIDEITLLVTQVDFRSREFFHESQEEIGRLSDRLAQALAHLDELAGDVTEHARRVGVGTARQLADHERDYTRALRRLVREIATALPRHAHRIEEALAQTERRLAVDARRRQGERSRSYRDGILRAVRDLTAGAEQALAVADAAVGESTARAHDRAQRAVTDAARDLRHVSALIEARDFRRRGWILATDEHGRAVPSVAGIAPGQLVNLTFRDGRAQAVVQTTQEDPA